MYFYVIWGSKATKVIYQKYLKSWIEPIILHILQVVKIFAIKSKHNYRIHSHYWNVQCSFSFSVLYTLVIKIVGAKRTAIILRVEITSDLFQNHSCNFQVTRNIWSAAEHIIIDLTTIIQSTQQNWNEIEEIYLSYLGYSNPSSVDSDLKSLGRR